jgi:prepilin-type N-terminal cleavage/methylation domain-containing protein
MHPMTRRGFTLIELLIGMVLTLLVAGIVYQVMVSSRRLQRTTYARMDTQQSARTAALFLTTALREIDAYSGDLIAASDTSLRYRAMRWTGMTCTPLSGGTPLTVGIRSTQLWGAGTPTVGPDSVLVYLERDPNTRNDDIWVAGVLTAVGNNTCSSGGTSRTVTFNIDAADGGNAAAVAGFRAGAPVRGIQQEEVTIITAAGDSWLGRRTMLADGTWSTYEPVIGPLTPGSGLRFTMFDSLMTATTTPSQAASVQFVIRAQSREIGYFNGLNRQHVDSVVSRVALRNNTRF